MCVLVAWSDQYSLWRRYDGLGMNVIIKLVRRIILVHFSTIIAWLPACLHFYSRSEHPVLIKIMANTGLTINLQRVTRMYTLFIAFLNVFSWFPSPAYMC